MAILKNVNDVRLGVDGVSGVYLGADLVWSAASAGWSVQSGTATLSSTGGVTVVVDDVDLSRSFAIATHRSTETNSNVAYVSADLRFNSSLNRTEIDITRNSSIGTVVVDWFVVELAPGLGTVSKYVETIGSPTSNVTISPVSLANSFVVSTNRVFGGGGLVNRTSSEYQAVAHLTSSTNLFVRRAHLSSGLSGLIAYVVTIPNATVQQGEIEVTESTTDVSLSAVNLSKSFALVSRTTTFSTDNTASVRGELTSSTNLRLTRNSSGTGVWVSYAVVEMPAGATVQQQTENGFTTATATSTLVNPVDLSRAVIFAGGSTQSSGSGRNINSSGFNTLKFNSATEIQSESATDQLTSGAFTATVVQW
jgi:hypothetical protein